MRTLTSLLLGAAIGLVLCVGCRLTGLALAGQGAKPDAALRVLVQTIDDEAWPQGWNR